MIGAWHRLRQRAADDAGISLIELLVAAFILTVGLLGILGVLSTSIRATGQQRAHTVATRVATQHIEQLRGLGYDELGDRDETTTQTFDQDGITYTVVTTTTTLEPDTGAEAATGEDGVRHVVADVTWTYQGRERSTSFQTAVAPRNNLTSAVPIDSDVQAIIGTDLRPQPTVVDSEGHPTDPVGVTAVLRGFSDTSIVTVRWTDDNGPSAPASLTTSDGGITWTGTISTTDITKLVDPGDEGNVGTSSLDVTFEAGDSAVAHDTLALQSRPENPPRVQSSTASVNPTTIRIEPGHHKHGCDHSASCRNVDQLTFRVHIQHVVPTDSPRLKYQLYNGTFQEQALQFDGNAETEGVTKWRLVLPARSVKIKAGSNQPFTFQVTRQSDGASGSYVKLINVQVTG